MTPASQYSYQILASVGGDQFLQTKELNKDGLQKAKGYLKAGNKNLIRIILLTEGGEFALKNQQGIASKTICSETIMAGLLAEFDDRLSVNENIREAVSKELGLPVINTVLLTLGAVLPEKTDHRVLTVAAVVKDFSVVGREKEWSIFDRNVDVVSLHGKSELGTVLGIERLRGPVRYIPQGYSLNADGLFGFYKARMDALRESAAMELDETELTGRRLTDFEQGMALFYKANKALSEVSV